MAHPLMSSSSRSLYRGSSMRSVPRSLSLSSVVLPDEPRVELDAKGRAARNQEKEEIKVLNNRFSELIGQVRKLEQENQVLQTRWELLQQGDSYKSNADKIINHFCGKLRQQLSDLERERDRLKMQIAQTQRMVDDFKQKYEDEINSRTAMENEFVILKKEIQELQSQIQSTAVTLKVRKSQQLDMQSIITDVKQQHAGIAAKNKAEAEAWYQNMLQDLENDKARQNEDMRNTKNEAAELNRQLQRLKSDIDGFQNQRGSLEANIVEVEDRGQLAIKEAKNHINDLQEALRKVKTDLADQAREHQELQNATMALDMEIATYRKLLDGEEERDGLSASDTIRMVNTVSAPRSSLTRTQLKTSY
ncbi:keratin, type II cytoskeletal 8-like isoform X2 [Narcine bancroftii]|uniref:keratin, type II cytoskeletal 8-like isoform X2 n=1 Tax=Narcine bancroftii TaxID=1343680 RepID=UPI0038319BF7